MPVDRVAAGAEGRPPRALGPPPERATWEEFLDLPSRVYAGDRRWCAPSRAGVESRLRRLAATGELAAWVERDAAGKVVARVATRARPEWRDPRGRPYGVVGWFEALAEPRDAGASALDAATAWLAARGARFAYGPIDGDTWHRYRFNVGPSEPEPFLLEPYNPPRYPELWRRRGFALVESYFSKRVDAPARVLAHLSPRAAAARAAGYRIQSLDPARFDAELDRLHELSRRIFRGNLLYTDVDRDEFAALYAGTERLIDPGMVAFAVAPDATDAGFVFALPDRFRAVAAMRGGSGASSALRFLLVRLTGRPRAANLKTVGVVDEHRGRGLAAALMARAYHRIVAAGYRATNHCLIRADNPSEALDGGVGVELRRYELYGREVPA